METCFGRSGKTQLTFLRSAVHSRERNEDIIIEAFIDITEMKGAQQAKDEAYQAKDDFFARSEEHTSELQSRGLISYAVFCLKKKTKKKKKKKIVTTYIAQCDTHHH